jgi:hypothetical protein
MTATVGARPIQPSIQKQLAQFMALLDPRCDFPEHNKVAQGEQCVRCHFDLWTYMDAIPKAWPS